MSTQDKKVMVGVTDISIDHGLFSPFDFREKVIELASNPLVGISCYFQTKIKKAQVKNAYRLDAVKRLSVYTTTIRNMADKRDKIEFFLGMDLIKPWIVIPLDSFLFEEIIWDISTDKKRPLNTVTGRSFGVDDLIEEKISEASHQLLVYEMRLKYHVVCDRSFLVMMGIGKEAFCELLRAQRSVLTELEKKRKFYKTTAAPIYFCRGLTRQIFSIKKIVNHLEVLALEIGA